MSKRRTVLRMLIIGFLTGIVMYMVANDWVPQNNLFDFLLIGVVSTVGIGLIAYVLLGKEGEPI